MASLILAFICGAIFGAAGLTLIAYRYNKKHNKNYNKN